jgi:head-tail adaptor
LLGKRRSRKSLATVFNKYVAIQERSDTTDREGGFTVSWSDITGYSQEPAAIWPLTAEQIAEYRTENSEVTHLIGLRGYVPITAPDVEGHANNRIVYDGRNFEIMSIENSMERDEQLIVMCRERRK